MVKSVFADTAYFIALNVRRDRFHRQARALEASLHKDLLTTEWVLTEVADGLAAPETRARFTRLINNLQARSDVKIVKAHPGHFSKGYALYAERKDKGWSLTDCISFLIMKENGIDVALTSDQHFVQAGFQILMDREMPGVAEPSALPYGAAGPTVPAAPPA
jgi:predicted nucleic acid-binding protein